MYVTQTISTFRLCVWFEGNDFFQELILANTDEESADDVARAILKTGARVVDVYEELDGKSYLTGFFYTEK